MRREIAVLETTGRGMTGRGMTRLGASGAALAAVLGGLAGCGQGSAGTGGSASPPPASRAPARQAPASALARSHMKVLAKLSRAQLCGVLSAAQARRLLHAAPGAPTYSSRLGLGITCQWVRRGATAASQEQLYVGVSSITDWTGTQALDRRLLHTRAVRVDGHPALAAATAAWGNAGWAQVDVALGTGLDPVAEYRAATLATALALARAATPGLIAMG